MCSGDTFSPLNLCLTEWMPSSRGWLCVITRHKGTAVTLTWTGTTGTSSNTSVTLHQVAWNTFICCFLSVGLGIVRRALSLDCRTRQMGT